MQQLKRGIEELSQTQCASIATDLFNLQNHATLKLEKNWKNTIYSLFSTHL